MTTINDCTVRYWLGPTRIMRERYFNGFKSYICSDYYTKYMPLMFIREENGGVWGYATSPIPDREKQHIRYWYGIDLFLHMEEI